MLFFVCKNPKKGPPNHFVFLKETEAQKSRRDCWMKDCKILNKQTENVFL